MSKKILIVLVLIGMFACAGFASAKTATPQLPKFRLVNFQATVRSMKGTDYTVEVIAPTIKIMQFMSGGLSGTVVVHTVVNKPVATNRNKNLNIALPSQKPAGLLQKNIAPKVGDKVTVTGILKSDGSVGQANFLVQKSILVDKKNKINKKSP
jgi:hypothetical protein